LFFCLTFANWSFSKVGKILKIEGERNAYLIRGTDKLNLSEDFELEEKDEIFTENSVVVLLVGSSTQIGLSKNTVLKIDQALLTESNDKSLVYSTIQLIKGLIRAQVMKDNEIEVEQKIISKNVVFAVRGTEFEVSTEEGDDVDLDVLEGIVEVSSPKIQSFVPEIVRANEGLRFSKREVRFLRRKFKKKFLNSPQFLSREKLKKLWFNRKNKMKKRDLEGKNRRQHLRGKRRS